MEQFLSLNPTLAPWWYFFPCHDFPASEPNQMKDFCYLICDQALIYATVKVIWSNLENLIEELKAEWIPEIIMSLTDDQLVKRCRLTQTKADGIRGIAQY